MQSQQQLPVRTITEYTQVTN